MSSSQKGRKAQARGSGAPKTARKTAPGVSPEAPGGWAESPITGARIPLGAHPGNTGGKPGRSGRIPSIVRAAALEEFAKRVPRIAAIADGNVPLTATCPECGYQAEGKGTRDPEVGDMLRAHDMLGKYGLGERGEFSPDVVAANVDRMLAVAESLMAPDDFATFAKHADTIWNDERRG